MTEQHKEKISKANKGRKPHKNTVNSKRRPVVQYDLKGMPIKEFRSASDAAKELNLSQPHITKCCQKKRRTHGGFIWAYKTGYKPSNTTPTRTGRHKITEP